MSRTTALGADGTGGGTLEGVPTAWPAGRGGRFRLAGVPARVYGMRVLGWDLPELSGRLFIGALFTVLTVRIVANFLETGRLTGLLLVASEALVVALTIVRRPAAGVDRSWQARLVATLSIAGPQLLRPAAGAGGTADLLAAGVSAGGLLVVVAGKISLGRSFGLMPANRGIVSSGLYRLVRHPIYLGYLVTHVAFLLANFGAWNLVVLAVADVALVIRSRYEEQTLAPDPGYRAYCDAVRWRLLPGLY